MAWPIVGNTSTKKPNTNRPTSNWRRRLLAMGAGCLLACLLAELLVVALFGSQIRFPRRVVEAPWGLRYNQPNSQYRHTSPDGTWEFRINSQGMRSDVDYRYEKQEGVVRILSLGDSFTIGYECNVEQCFSTVLQDELRAQGIEAEVLNCGMSGASTAEELVYFEKELLKYQPNVVVVSFYANDPVDNLRSDLFRLEGDVLQRNRERYIPGGSLANFLNGNPVIGVLSERSNAFAFAKERATSMLKEAIVRQNQRNIAAADSDTTPISDDAKETHQSAADADGYPSRLCVALFDRFYEVAHEHGIAIVIQSIPFPRFDGQLVDVFPAEEFDSNRPGLTYIPMGPILEPWRNQTLLYWQHSHLHWTPFSHELSGRELARSVQQHLMRSAM